MEDAYYQLLPKPYRRKNAPYDSLEELHMVRGVTDDFWSTFVDPEPTNPKKRVDDGVGAGRGQREHREPADAARYSLLGHEARHRSGRVGELERRADCDDPPAGLDDFDLDPRRPASIPNLPAICSDPNQTALFTMAMTMAKGITMGAPLFGSPQDFISMMKGQGMIGPLLTMLGIQPVAFQSESDFAKSITTESKMFSMYAVGVVKGYKRETRLSIHEVVDFRTAPVVSAAPSSAASSPMGAVGVTAPTPSAGPSSSASADPNSIAAAMQPSTGGQVIYFHLE